jgi:hypothetical protein
MVHAIIYLRYYSRNTFICLPTTPCTRHTCEQQLSVAYLAFQHLRFTQYLYYYKYLCALTAHFHPYPPKAGGYFLWHLLCTLLYKHPLGVKLLYAVRTFLSQPKLATIALIAEQRYALKAKK